LGSPALFPGVYAFDAPVDAVRAEVHDRGPSGLLVDVGKGDGSAGVQRREAAAADIGVRFPVAQGEVVPVFPGGFYL
jgi:hypothetical protein